MLFFLCLLQQTVGRRGEGHRGTPIPFTKPAPSVEEEEEEGGDGESSDGSMTEVTEVVTPFSDHEEDEEMDRIPPATPSDEDDEGGLVAECIRPYSLSFLTWLLDFSPAQCYYHQFRDNSGENLRKTDC